VHRETPETSRSTRTAAPRAARVAIVDDHELVALALGDRIDAREGLEFVGRAETVDQLVRRSRPADLVVLDLNLRDGSLPADNVARIRKWGAQVLVLTSGENPYLTREASRTDVLGVVRKSARPDRILDAIAAAATGQPVVTTEWAVALESDPELRAAPLTEREREVLELYALGLGAKAVAAKLHVSESTVIDHIRRIRAIYAQLQRPANTKVELYQRGLEDGYLPFPSES